MGARKGVRGGGECTQGERSCGGEGGELDGVRGGGESTQGEESCGGREEGWGRGRG